MRGVVLWVVGGILLLASCIAGGCSCVPSVEPGFVGVEKTWGKLHPEPFQSGGPYFINPTASVIRVNVQTQKLEEDLSIPMKGGLSVQMHVVLLYKVRPEKAAYLLNEAAGGNYKDIFVEPTFRNAVRDTCPNHVPEDLYDGNTRLAIESQILARVTHELEPRGFTCDQVMIQDPRLPAAITERVQAKIAAEQDAIRMQSVYKQREQEAMANKRQKELEAEAKVIEAKGIAEAQRIIQKELTMEYLYYQHIEALKEFGKHGNSTYFVPVGVDGMPLFGAIKSKGLAK